MEHLRTVFKMDITEETGTLLQEEEATAFSCHILATPMLSYCANHVHQQCKEPKNEKYCYQTRLAS